MMPTKKCFKKILQQKMKLIRVMSPILRMMSQSLIMMSRPPTVMSVTATPKEGAGDKTPNPKLDLE